MSTEDHQHPGQISLGGGGMSGAQQQQQAFGAGVLKGSGDDLLGDNGAAGRKTRRAAAAAAAHSNNDMSATADDMMGGSDDDSDEGGGKKKEKKGRRKIKIEFIDDKSRRHITFSKRKAGIMKKVRLGVPANPHRNFSFGLRGSVLCSKLHQRLPRFHFGYLSSIYPPI